MDTGLGGGARNEVVELPVRKVRRHGAIVAEQRHLVFRDVNPSARSAMSIFYFFSRVSCNLYAAATGKWWWVLPIALIHDMLPVGHATHQITDMD